MSAKMNVPQLRFSEFSGEWKNNKFGNLCSFFSGGTPASTNRQYYLGNIPFIGSGKINDENVEQFITRDALQNSSAKMVEVGDLLYALYGATSGEVAISKINGAINQAVLCIRSEESKYFLYSWLKLNKERILTRFLQGGQGNLSANIIKNLKLNLPSKQEQEKIASFLSSIDTKIEQLTSKVKLLQVYKKGVMQKIFSQEIRFNNNGCDKVNGEAREGTLGCYPEWAEKRLGDIAIFTKGKGISKEDIAEDGRLECIRYGELYTQYNEIIKDTTSKTNLNSDDLVLSKYNDIIIPSSGETSIDIATASCVLKDDIALGGDLNIIRTEENGIFLAYYLNNAKKYDIAKLSQGSSVVHLYAVHLKTLKINLPSLKEQTKIANFLSSIDTKIEQVQKN